MMSNKKLIIIAGPTAIGKTALSIRLAKHYQCPILSFDSRQIYKEMNIGTAKPSTEELAAAEHHFIGTHSIHERYTAGIFEKEALETLDKIFETNEYCIAVGGSGLYINALAYGIDDIPSNEAIRARLKEEWQTFGLEKLAQKVKDVDPEYYEIGDMQNSRRVIRALETFELTHEKYSELRKKTAKKRPFQMAWIGLNTDREILFNQINSRVEIMVKKGLIEEVKSLEPFNQLKALKTVGYSELFSYLKNEIPLEEAIRLIQRNTRHFAKRQVTWFAKNTSVNWFKPDQDEDITHKINQIFLP